MYYSEGGLPRMYMQEESTVSFVLAKMDTSSNPVDTLKRIDMAFVGEEVQLKDPVIHHLKDYIQNFYFPHCGANGVTGVIGYSRVVYQDVWPETDVHFYSGQAGQKMSFVVKPGGVPENIQLQLTGQDQLDIHLNGILEIWTGGEVIRLPEAVAYQVSGSSVIPLGWNAEYSANNGSGIVGLAFQSYDPSLPLILQVGPPPVGQGPYDEVGLCWSTYMGGDGDELINGSDEHAGNYYIGGHTNSQFIYFPGQAGNIPVPGNNFAFTTGFDASDQIIWKSFFGGGAGTYTFGRDIAVGSAGNIHQVGYTNSNNMQHTLLNNAFNQGSVSSTSLNKGVIIRYSAMNGVVDWSTYFGDDDVVIHGIEITGKEMYICGSSKGSMPLLDIPAPATATVESYSGFGQDGFVANFTYDLLHWTTFINGNGDDIALDLEATENTLAVVVNTQSSDLFVSNIGGVAYEQGFFGGNYTDIYATKFDATTLAVKWASYFGSNQPEQIGNRGLALERSSNDIILAGKCSGAGISIEPGTGWFQSTATFGGSGFIARIDGLSHQLEWQTYVDPPGASSAASIEAAEFDSNGNLHLGGQATIFGLPSINPGGMYEQTTINIDQGGTAPETDMYLMSFTPSQNVSWSSYFGGEASGIFHESVYTLLKRSNGSLYAAGLTSKGANTGSYFPLDDGNNIPWFEDTWQGSSRECFIAAFCGGIFTDVSEFDEESTVNIHAFVDNANTLHVSGAFEANSTLSVFDARGRVVHRK